jgi:hypothetical protein
MQRQSAAGVAHMIQGTRFTLLLFIVFGGMTLSAWAGGPKYVAGSTYFNSSVMGTPAHWSGGVVNYSVDQGDLSASLPHAQAVAMVDAAAALWSSVSTAAVQLTNVGTLAEDVSGANIAVNSSSVITAPSDVTPSATTTPLAVIFDYDGSVINAIYGTDASDPDSCNTNGVFVWIDNINTDATIAHGVLLLNGLCTSTNNQISMMSFNIERAFGRVLGLDYAQIYPDALTADITGQTQAWPLLQPLDGVCTSAGGDCVPLPSALHWDDIAALNRLYPVTDSNLSSFTGKQLTAANTISIKGTVSFSSGYGMQGVNVVALPYDGSGNPLYEYTVSTVTGALYRGTWGNSIVGTGNASGVAYSKWGSNNSALQGAFDLSDIPLPSGLTTASYKVYFEAIEADYINSASVGPYVLGQVEPSGTLSSTTYSDLAAGASETLNLTVSDSAQGGSQDAIGSEGEPRALPSSGFWVGRLSQISQSDWLNFSVRAGHSFTVVTQALDESGTPSNTKAMPMVGVWNESANLGSSPTWYAEALNGGQAGECWLQVSTNSDNLIRMAIADARGDGRPDYKYSGWVLYADSVSPSHLTTAGGAFTIQGMGFRASDTVQVGGQAAVVTSISPNEITAIAPAASAGAADVVVNDQSSLNASTTVTDGISYDSGTGDALTLITAPQNTVPTMTPLAFTVQALDANLAPIGNATVTYTLTSGTATLNCGASSCAVTTSGDGYATLYVTANDTTNLSVVTAKLTNTANVQAHFTGGTPARVTALTGLQSVAAGQTISWTVEAQVILNGELASGQSVVWQTGVTGITPPTGANTATTNASGIATMTLKVGPLSDGQEVSINACVNGTSYCATFYALGARPEYAELQAVSGTSQSVATTTSPAPIVLRVLDMDGNKMASGTVVLYQALYTWTQSCPAHQECGSNSSGALLATSSSVATSDLNGLVSFTPISISGTATTLKALATSGYTATVNATVERYPNN